MTTHADYLARRIQTVTPQADGAMLLALSDREVILNRPTYTAYQALVESLSADASVERLAERLELTVDDTQSLVEGFAQAGLLYRRDAIPRELTGREFVEKFDRVLPAWLQRAFSHEFWARMMEGRGSRRLFVGWLFELYHYTLNANRHMPLSCAHTQLKPVKKLRAQHYAEEWNHYHYFAKALGAMGYSRELVARSEPLPMTMAMSNFMRQAAREDVLAYSICSAVLEGTTVGEGNYVPYYEKMVELYGVPRGAIEPIYAHLALDQTYKHSNLFEDIMTSVDQLPSERAARIVAYGSQMADHIWLWTDEIDRYYGDPDNPVPRLAFDPDHD
jgi:pyrroloquinoline quinone (PQQ) biosynthesis protein C